jgi:thiamine kinase-like enzyme
MRTVHLNLLCEHFNLGSKINSVARIYGGLLHVMWRVDTNNGSYAVKQLSEDINLTDKAVVNNYDLTEKVALRFAEQSIPAICALIKSENFLFVIDNTGYLVYPWVDAKSLGRDEVSIGHALEITRLLAKMHLMDLQIEGMLEAEFDIHDNDKIIALADLAKQQNLLFGSSLRDNLATLLEINKNYHSAISTLKKHTVISHGDLDQKNVLWNLEGNPILIDWESARKLNPTYEIVNAALDWSGITTQFDKNLFAKMISAYKEVGGIIYNDILEAAFFGVLGNWINWMIYNIGRAANVQDSEQQKIGTEQVVQVLPTILRINGLMPELINTGKL